MATVARPFDTMDGLVDELHQEAGLSLGWHFGRRSQESPSKTPVVQSSEDSPAQPLEETASVPEKTKVEPIQTDDGRPCYERLPALSEEPTRPHSSEDIQIQAGRSALITGAVTVAVATALVKTELVNPGLVGGTAVPIVLGGMYGASRMTYGKWGRFNDIHQPPYDAWLAEKQQREEGVRTLERILSQEQLHSERCFAPLPAKTSSDYYGQAKGKINSCQSVQDLSDEVRDLSSYLSGVCAFESPALKEQAHSEQSQVTDAIIDYSELVEACREDSRTYSRECWERSSVFRNGEVRPVAEAVPFFEIQCEKGRPWACYNEGYLYDTGTGVEQDKSRAFEIYQSACEAGSMAACSNQALIYNGKAKDNDDYEAVNRYHRKGLRLAEKACDAGHHHACANVAYHYLNGTGDLSSESASDRFETAIEYLTLTCKGGEQEMCKMVLEMQDAQAEERRRSEREEERHVAHCSQYSSTGLRAKYQCQKDWDVYSVRLHWNPISEGLSYFGNLPCFWYDDCGFCPIDELPGYCEGAWKVISP